MLSVTHYSQNDAGIIRPTLSGILVIDVSPTHAVERLTMLETVTESSC